jgi:hypothetical protein
MGDQEGKAADGFPVEEIEGRGLRPWLGGPEGITACRLPWLH